MSSSTSRTMLWRRLDAPGHDACRLTEVAEGARLEGCAVFRHRNGAAQIHYSVVADRQWRTVKGEVRGWIGGVSLASVITRSGEGEWLLNGVAQPQAAGCQDLDLAFTPATNLLQLRRLDLAPGTWAEYSVAWLDVGADALQPLPQRYQRLGHGDYDYGSPTVGYAATLQVTEAGFITSYPGLWEVEATPSAGSA